MKKLNCFGRKRVGGEGERIEGKAIEETKLGPKFCLLFSSRLLRIGLGNALCFEK